MRQSIRRLAKDLQIDGTNSREWRILPNPSGTTGVSDIRAGIQEWLTPGLPPSRKRTALIVVMKNKKRLENLAVAEHYLSPTAGKNRLMMVHPSQTTNNHQVYFDWVTAVKDVWDRLLRKPATDPDRQQLLGAFSKSYASLTDTGSALPSFDQVAGMLPYAVASTQVRLLNATPSAAPQIDWNSHDAYILVGGQAMDRASPSRD